MQTLTASSAKQNFGELIDSVRNGPVAIERHKRVKAIVCDPTYFDALSANVPDDMAERKAARAAQQGVERERLLKHYKVAVALLAAPAKKRAAMVDGARQIVARWRQSRVCSVDYCDKWEEILSLPLHEMTAAICSEEAGWARALRQNSPWHLPRP